LVPEERNRYLRLSKHFGPLLTVVIDVVLDNEHPDLHRLQNNFSRRSWVLLTSAFPPLELLISKIKAL
jgi:hypothetical protein